MIEGCLAWQKDGLRPPKAVNSATQEYLDSEDAMQNFFNDCCVIAKNEYDTFEHIWDGYVDWCEDCREYIGTKKAFGQKLKDKGLPGNAKSTPTSVSVVFARTERSCWRMQSRALRG